MATNVKMKSATYEQPPFHSIRICDLTAASTLEAQPCVRQARTIDKKLLNKKYVMTQKSQNLNFPSLTQTWQPKQIESHHTNFSNGTI